MLDGDARSRKRSVGEDARPAKRGDAGTCLGCGSRLPDPFLDLGRTPLANAYLRPDKASKEEAAYRLAVAYCPNCHLTQLTERVPPRKMFSEYLYFSSYSTSFLEHARQMAHQLIQRFQLTPLSRVLEIASNDGYLLQHFQKEGIPVLGVEPAGNIASEAERKGIPTLNRFFGVDSVEEIRGSFGQADLIIGNNVLAHVPAINDFLKAAASCLRPAGAVVFEFPYLLDLMEKTEFDTIYHEHVFYYSLSALETLAQRAGLELFDVNRHSVHGGSLRVFLQHKNARPTSAAVKALIAEENAAGLTEARTYASFSHKVRDVKRALLEMLHGLKASGKRLAAYGAPAKGNTLLNYCGIGTDLLEFTVDRSPHKQGLLLPGSRLPIRPPEDLLREKPDYAVILPWNLADEILSQQKEYLRLGGKFIVPIPHPREAAG